MNFKFDGIKPLTIFAPIAVKNPAIAELKIVDNGKCNVLLLNLKSYKNPIMNPDTETDWSEFNFTKTVLRKDICDCEGLVSE